MDYRIFLYARLICSFISFFIHRYNYRYYCKSHFAIEKSQTLYIRWSIFQTIIIRRLMHIELVQVWVFLSFSTSSKIFPNIHVCKKIKVNKHFQSRVTSAKAYNYGSIWRGFKKNDMVLNSYCLYMYLNINKTVIRVNRYPNSIDTY